MADLVETSAFDPGIYQFETSDIVQGGPGGIDNRPTNQLANRTRFLLNNKLARDGSQAMTGTLRVGDGSTGIAAQINGTPSGAGGGGSVGVFTAGTPRIEIGNISYLLGGAFNPNGLVLARDDLAFAAGNVEGARLQAGSRNFGIGTSSPIVKFDVSAPIGAGGVIQQLYNTDGVGRSGVLVQMHQSNVALWRFGMPAGSDAFAIYGWQGGAFPEYVRWDSAGNMGLGTSTPARKLDIRAASLNGDGLTVTNTQSGTGFQLLANGTAGFAAPGWANSTVFEAICAAGGSFILSAYQSPFVIQTGIGRATRFVINQNGEVSIGRATSNRSLSVDGGIETGTGAPLSGLFGSNPADSFAGPNGNLIGNYNVTWKQFSDAPNGPTLVQSGFGGIRAYTQGVERYRIDGAGNLGYGTPAQCRIHWNMGNGGEMRLQGTAAYLSGYDNAGANRLGYVQFNPNEITINAERPGAVVNLLAQGALKAQANSGGFLVNGQMAAVLGPASPYNVRVLNTEQNGGGGLLTPAGAGGGMIVSADGGPLILSGAGGERGRFDSGGFLTDGLRLNAMNSRSLGGSGYQVLPGGLILQWQRQAVGDVATGAGGSVGSLNFPIAFPSQILHAQISLENVSGQAAISAVITSYNRFNLSWQVSEWAALSQNATVVVFVLGI